LITHLNVTKSVIIDNIKRNLSPCNLCVLVRVNQSWILTSNFALKCPNIYTNILPDFLPLSSLTFHIHFHFSQTTVCYKFITLLPGNVFDRSYYIAALFQNHHYAMYCLSCHVLIMYTFIELSSLTQHIFRNVLTAVTRSVSTLCEHKNQ
jgi:hypothetical protein